jgi:hypothetical protein
MFLKTQLGSRNEAKKYMKTNGLLEISCEKDDKLLKTHHMALLKAANFQLFPANTRESDPKTSENAPFRAKRTEA